MELLIFLFKHCMCTHIIAYFHLCFKMTCMHNEMLKEAAVMYIDPD